jgi:hypothetical protein
MTDWGATPGGSRARVYLPGIRTTEVLEMVQNMYGTHRPDRVDDHTLQCQTYGITYIPVPPGVGVNFAGLLTADLPEKVGNSQAFTIVVRQVTSAVEELPIDTEFHSRKMTREGKAATRPNKIWRRILGKFQIIVPVRTKEEMFEPKVRLLSVHRWVQKTALNVIAGFQPSGGMLRKSQVALMLSVATPARSYHLPQASGRV